MNVPEGKRVEAMSVFDGHLYASSYVGGRATFCFVLVPLWKGVTTHTAIEQCQSIVIGNLEVRRIDTEELSFAGCGRAIAAVKWNEAFRGRVKLLLVGFA